MNFSINTDRLETFLGAGIVFALRMLIVETGKERKGMSFLMGLLACSAIVSQTWQAECNFGKVYGVDFPHALYFCSYIEKYIVGNWNHNGMDSYSGRNCEQIIGPSIIEDIIKKLKHLELLLYLGTFVK